MSPNEGPASSSSSGSSGNSGNSTSPSSLFSRVPTEILLEALEAKLSDERRKVAKEYALPSEEEYEQEAHDWDDACRPRENMAKAIRDGRYYAVEGFLDAGVNPNSYTLGSRSLLGLAICKEQVGIVQLLLIYGANPELPQFNPPASRVTHMYSAALACMAAGMENKEDKMPMLTRIVDLLLRFGAKINAMREFTAMVGGQLPTSLLDRAILNGSDLPGLTVNNSTVLHISIDHRYDDYSYYLLRRFPELLDVTDSSGSSAMAHALLHSNEPLALGLLRHNASVGTVDAWGVSDMWLAVNRGYVQVVREMLARWDGSLGTIGMDPLQTAVTVKQFDIVLLLVEHPAFQSPARIRLAVASLLAYPEYAAQELARALTARFPEFVLSTRAVI